MQSYHCVDCGNTEENDWFCDICDGAVCDDCAAEHGCDDDEDIDGYVYLEEDESGDDDMDPMGEAYYEDPNDY